MLAPRLVGEPSRLGAGEGGVTLRSDEAGLVPRRTLSPRRSELDPSYARHTRARFPDKSGNHLFRILGGGRSKKVRPCGGRINRLGSWSLGDAGSIRGEVSTHPGLHLVPRLVGETSRLGAGEGGVTLGSDEAGLVSRGTPSPRKSELDPSYARHSRARFPDKSGNHPFNLRGGRGL